jgi:hypothetical protein
MRPDQRLLLNGVPARPTSVIGHGSTRFKLLGKKNSSRFAGRLCPGSGGGVRCSDSAVAFEHFIQSALAEMGDDSEFAAPRANSPAFWAAANFSPKWVGKKALKDLRNTAQTKMRSVLS